MNGRAVPVRAEQVQGKRGNEEQHGYRSHAGRRQRRKQNDDCHDLSNVQSEDALAEERSEHELCDDRHQQDYEARHSIGCQLEQRHRFHPCILSAG